MNAFLCLRSKRLGSRQQGPDLGMFKRLNEWVEAIASEDEAIELIPRDEGPKLPQTSATIVSRVSGFPPTGAW